MNGQGMIELIKNVGFPIVAFLLMFYLSITVIGENTRALTELSELIRRLL